MSSPFHGIFSTLGNDASALTSVEEGESVAIENEDTQVAGSSQGHGKGQIAVDVYEQEGYYIIRAPIGGVKLSDLDIEVDGKVVTIRGIRSTAEEIAEEKFYVQECFWGEFARSVTLPCNVDPKKVKATFSKDGVLKVLVPKEEKVKIVRVSEG